MKKNSLLFSFRFLLFLLLLLTVNVFADVLALPDYSNEPPNNIQGLLRPTTGMSMKQVEAKFGVPVKKLKAVGKPPISRWKYSKFTVHFEYDKVIHSVVRRRTPAK